MTKLLLRPSVIEDCLTFARWESTEIVTEFFSISRDWRLEDVTKDFLRNEADDSKVQLTVIDEETESLIGRVYITRFDDYTKSLDITRIYIGDRNNRGLGYGREALRLVLDWAFKEKGMHRITLDHFPGNEIASNLYLSMGFKYEGVARDAAMKDGKYYDLELMSILEEEYK